MADNTDLWLAQYTEGTPSWPTGTYAQWTLWQYSESGHIDGIDGSTVDLNRYNGPDQDLLTWIAPAGSSPGPNPDPEPDAVVSIALTIPPNVSLQMSINGTPVEIVEEEEK